MRTRPTTASGDMLPVTALSSLRTGPEALSSALTDFLHFYLGDWWETPSRGNPVLNLLSENRYTAQDAQVIGSALTAYLESFPPVASVSDVQTSFSGRQLNFSCTVHTLEGEETVVSTSASG